ncbi:EAL and HDOD domain-containing protein [Photobacterium chitinilyticum]|uniref:HDOD domain-containing protein n=1 Tax=Photobacterium chitinilyticum TaxID=2485123 RepID=A0A3S3QPE9_9GAMM|nr:HDOD domain-containing protein [Photobacterium chitinilyticum]RWX55246.1 HDOD domain-containing protein [Photobacterium chitinilyticum]
MHSYLARQPVLNRDKATVGYELLFRDGPNNCFPDVGDEHATNRLLADNFFTSGAIEATGGKKAFVNFPYNSLIQRTPLMFPKKSFIIEILETCDPSDELLEAVIELKEKGYTLALDDFIPSAAWNRFLPHIHIIKFDIRTVPIAKARFFMRHHKDKVNKILFLAEKVETHDEFTEAYDAGFDLFQGFFFSQPEMMQRKTLTPCALTTLRLYKEITLPDVDFNTVESIIATDVSLSYKLLRHVNNMRYSQAKPISSFKQALVYLGEERLKRFVTFVATAHATEKKPQSLYSLSLQRAHFCERLSNLAATEIIGNQAFLTGLFSLLDSLLDQPIEDVITLLPLSKEVQKALVHQTGPLGSILKLIMAYDKAQWEDVSELSKQLGLHESDIADLYMESLKWASYFEKTATD